MGTFLRLAFPSGLTLILLGVAIAFAFRPTERKLGILRALSLALVFALVGLAFAGVANTLKAAARQFSSNLGQEAVRVMLNGFSEALIPGMVGFAALAVSWGFVAVGFRRQV
jgi:hypothetical protein